MSDSDPRWHRDQVLYRINLPQWCVRPWINIRRTHQATCWKMFLLFAVVVHCSPDTENRCSQDSSPCFIISCVDYYNSVFGNASAVHLYPLQSVLHAAARVITRNRKYDHIPATIHDQLHWLPVKQRIDHKLCTFIYKCLHNMAPVYQCDMCIPMSSISGRSSLPSAAHGNLWYRHTRTKTFDPRAFAVLGPSIWNTLPATVHNPLLTYGQFCSKLKSVMFNGAYMTWPAALTWQQCVIRLARSSNFAYLHNFCDNNSNVFHICYHLQDVHTQTVHDLDLQKDQM